VTKEQIAKFQARNAELKRRVMHIGNMTLPMFSEFCTEVIDLMLDIAEAQLS